MKDVIVRVPTKEDWINVANVAFSKGYIWKNGDKDIGVDDWFDCKEKSCISIISERMGYCDEQSYKIIYFHIPIMSAQEFLEEEIEYGAKDRKDPVKRIELNRKHREYWQQKMLDPEFRAKYNKQRKNDYAKKITNRKRETI